MRSFYATTCKTDCLQILYKFCKFYWISVPNIVHQLILSLHWNIQNSGDALDAINSMRGMANNGERATERSQWRQSSMTSFVLKPYVAARTCLWKAILTVLGEYEPKNVVGHRVDPKKALPYATTRTLSHCASKSIHRSLQQVSPGKFKIKIEVNRWAKVANETANINVQNRSL